MAVAAMASGGDTMAPKAIAAAHPIPGMSETSTNATAAVVVRTSPNASRLIDRTLRHSSRGELR
jgi:hypothetical protein